jgi:hypothetical protein
MEKNVCGVDRFVRAVLGLLLVTRLLRSQRGTGETISLGQILTVYAVAELSVNVVAQWCPLNALLGFDSCSD